MKAIVYSNYGAPNVLRLEDIPKPAPADDEVVIRVCASTVNPADWHFMRGTPYLVRMMTGLRKPKISRLGIDVAGEVEGVGRNVTNFKNGDHVFGWCRGAFAEYESVRASAIVTKPPNVTFEDAACVPVAAVTALQGLRDITALIGIGVEAVGEGPLAARVHHVSQFGLIESAAAQTDWGTRYSTPSFACVARNHSRYSSQVPLSGT